MLTEEIGGEICEFPLKLLKPWTWDAETKGGVRKLSPTSAPAVWPSWAGVHGWEWAPPGSAPTPTLSSSWPAICWQSPQEEKAIVLYTCVCGVSCASSQGLFVREAQSQHLIWGWPCVPKPSWNLGVFAGPSPGLFRDEGREGGVRAHVCLFPAEAGLFVFLGSSLSTCRGGPLLCPSSDVLTSDVASLTPSASRSSSPAPLPPFPQCVCIVAPHTLGVTVLLASLHDCLSAPLCCHCVGTLKTGDKGKYWIDVASVRPHAPQEVPIHTAAQLV